MSKFFSHKFAWRRNCSITIENLNRENVMKFLSLLLIFCSLNSFAKFDLDQDDQEWIKECMKEGNVKCVKYLLDLEYHPKTGEYIGGMNPDTPVYGDDSIMTYWYNSKAFHEALDAQSDVAKKQIEILTALLDKGADLTEAFTRAPKKSDCDCDTSSEYMFPDFEGRWYSILWQAFGKSEKPYDLIKRVIETKVNGKRMALDEYFQEMVFKSSVPHGEKNKIYDLLMKNGSPPEYLVKWSLWFGDIDLLKIQAEHKANFNKDVKEIHYGLLKGAGNILEKTQILVDGGFDANIPAGSIPRGCDFYLSVELNRQNSNEDKVNAVLYAIEKSGIDILPCTKLLGARGFDSVKEWKKSALEGRWNR